MINYNLDNKNLSLNQVSELSKESKIMLLNNKEELIKMRKKLLKLFVLGQDI